MGSQFDEIAKAIAQGVNRRRALRAMLGGFAGAVVATLMAGSKAPSVEAGPAESTSPAVQAKPNWNQRRPGMNQVHQRPNWNQTRVHMNQARLNQWRSHLNQQRPTWNQARFNQARFNQARLNAIRSKFNQGHPGWNQVPHHLNQGRPRTNSQPVRINEPPIKFNASGNGPTLNMVRGGRFGPTQRP